jgi:hypothetical protein
VLGHTPYLHPDTPISMADVLTKAAEAGSAPVKNGQASRGGGARGSRGRRGRGRGRGRGQHGPSAGTGTGTGTGAGGRDRIPVSQEDFLEQDPAIRGQNFAIVSFVSPEDVLVKKEVFAFNKFMKAIATDVGVLLDGLATRYPDDATVRDSVRGLRERYGYLWSPDDMQGEFNTFSGVNADRIQADFNAANGFQTSIRGLKVRGVYDSQTEAQARIEALRRLDNNRFNIYMMNVGCWCPWSPNPEEIKDTVYAETELNTLVNKYNENREEKDAVYEVRKRDMIERMGTDNCVWAERRAAETVQATRAATATGEAVTEAALEAAPEAAPDAVIAACAAAPEAAPETAPAPEAAVPEAAPINIPTI